MKHAYLIMCYNNFKILDKLIELLDSEENDFFIHVDAKTPGTAEQLLTYRPQASKVYFTERIKVYWGSINELKGNLILMHAAMEADTRYDYLHFMQGADFPIKTAKQIRRFFEANKGKEFLYIDPEWYSLGDYKLNYHHLFVNNPYYRRNKLLRIISNGIARLEQLLGLKLGNEKIYSGSAMWTLSEEAVRFLLSREDYIIRRCKYAIVPVEMIWHTLLMNSSFAERVYDFEKRWLQSIFD